MNIGYEGACLNSLALSLSALIALAASPTQSFAQQLPQTPQRVNFENCHVGGGYNCVVDGDTIWFRGVKIRIAEIDAPETHEPRCASERSLGNRATSRLLQLLENGAITLQSIGRDQDRYGRKLRLVLVDGRSVGDVLVSEGLARYYNGRRRAWC